MFDAKKCKQITSLQKQNGIFRKCYYLHQVSKTVKLNQTSSPQLKIAAASRLPITLTLEIVNYNILVVVCFQVKV